MSGIDPDVRASIRQWVEYADDDLRVAKHSLGMGDECPPQIVAYHAQQCVEKYLKGYLVLRGIDFPFTHSLAWLFELCEANGEPFEDMRDAEELTPYAVITRYPDQNIRVTRAQAERAVELAAQARERIRRLLSDAGMSDLP